MNPSLFILCRYDFFCLSNEKFNIIHMIQCGITPCIINRFFYDFDTIDLFGFLCKE